MLSKREVLRLVVALARMNDSQVLSSDDGLMEEVCAPADRATVREIRGLVIPLRQSLDYCKTPEFAAAVAGKSSAFEQMQKRLAADPAKRKAFAIRVDKALEDLLDSEDAFLLLPTERHAALMQIRHHAERLHNPD